MSDHPVTGASSAIPVQPVDMVLSTQSLGSAGIKTELTQNDLVELIATEKYEAIQEEIEIANVQGMLAQKMLDGFQAQQVQSFKEDLLTEKCLTEEQLKEDTAEVRATYEHLTGNPLYLTQLQVNAGYRRKNQLRSVQLTAAYRLAPGSLLKIKVMYCHSKSREVKKTGFTGQLSVTENKSYEKLVPVPEALMKEYIKSVEDHNASIQKLLEKYKNMEFDPVKFIQSIKVRLNKEILKSNAAGVVERLNTVFNMDL